MITATLGASTRRGRLRSSRQRKPWCARDLAPLNASAVMMLPLPASAPLPDRGRGCRATARRVRVSPAVPSPSLSRGAGEGFPISLLLGRGDRFDQLLHRLGGVVLAGEDGGDHVIAGLLHRGRRGMAVGERADHRALGP